jgi:hypothetical protein
MPVYIFAKPVTIERARMVDLLGTAQLEKNERSFSHRDAFFSISGSA